MPERTQRNVANTPLRVSVVIPVYNAAPHLERCLAALSRSTYPHYECVVVDDGSKDCSREVARRAPSPSGEYPAQVITLSQNRGPAHARNQGALAAGGDVLLFIDADVCVQPETVGRIAAAFERDPEVAAVMGSYDDQPDDVSFLSQYKNLFHHYVHQHGQRQASTFWSGCGAVRRTVFLAAGGFNEGYDRACIEDIELGFRLRQSGHRIVLDKAIQAKHLKRWSFADLVRTDLFFRGVPWVALMLRDRHIIHDLNLSWHARAGTALAYVLLLVVALLLGTGHAVAALPLLWAVGCGAISAALYDRMAGRHRDLISAGGLIALVAVIGAVGRSIPLALLPLGILLAIMTIHCDFYRFLVQRRGGSFALAAVPFHLLFFLYSGLAIPLGAGLYVRQRQQARKWGTGPAVVPVQVLEAESSSARMQTEQAPLVMAGAGTGANCPARSESP